MKKILLPTCMIFLAIISCNKKEKEANCVTSTTTLSGNYKFSSIKYKQTPTSAEVDLFATFAACEKDDIHNFAANGTYSYQDAGVVCSPNGSYVSTWSYVGTTFTVDGDIATIQSFDCKTLIAYTVNQQVAGDRVTYTLIKQ